MGLSLTLSILISAVGIFFFTSSRDRTVFLFLQSILMMFFASEPLFIWISCILIWFFVRSFDGFIKIKREKDLQWATLDYLNSCILHLDSGFSMQNAMKESISSISNCKKQIFQQIWQNLFQHRENKPFESIFFEKLSEELMFIVGSSQKTTEQIRKLRSQIKTELYFRRKSGQVLRSLRIQSLALSLIYILFAFILQTQLDIISHGRIVLLSMTLFIAGLVWMFKIGKDLKWKV
jgi:hypothetical protein